MSSLFFAWVMSFAQATYWNSVVLAASPREHAIIFVWTVYVVYLVIVMPAKIWRLYVRKQLGILNQDKPVFEFSLAFMFVVLGLLSADVTADQIVATVVRLAAHV